MARILLFYTIVLRGKIEEQLEDLEISLAVSYNYWTEPQQRGEPLHDQSVLKEEGVEQASSASPLQPAGGKTMSKQPSSNDSQVEAFVEGAWKPYTTVDIASSESAKLTPEDKLSAHVQEMLLKVPNNGK